MTEAEASTKWCPLIQLSGINLHVGEFVTGKPYCIGSHCMMWQWKFVDNKYDDPNAPKEGYCGLTR